MSKCCGLSEPLHFFLVPLPTFPKELCFVGLSGEVVYHVYFLVIRYHDFDTDAEYSEAGAEVVEVEGFGFSDFLVKTDGKLECSWFVEDVVKALAVRNINTIHLLGVRPFAYTDISEKELWLGVVFRWLSYFIGWRVVAESDGVVRLHLYLLFVEKAVPATAFGHVLAVALLVPAVSACADGVAEDDGQKAGAYQLGCALYAEPLVLGLALDVDCRGGLHRGKRVEVGLQRADACLKMEDARVKGLTRVLEIADARLVCTELPCEVHQFGVVSAELVIEAIELRVDGGDVGLALVQVLHLLRTHGSCTLGGGLADAEGVGLCLRGASGDVALVDGEVHVVAVVRADGDVGDESVELGEKVAPSGDARHVRL